jgi:hypothetical protein
MLAAICHQEFFGADQDQEVHTCLSLAFCPLAPCPVRTPSSSPADT